MLLNKAKGLERVEGNFACVISLPKCTIDKGRLKSMSTLMFMHMIALYSVEAMKLMKNNDADVDNYLDSKIV